MRIETFYNIKEAAGDRELNILVFDLGLSISPRAIGALKAFGQVVIAVKTYLEKSTMGSKVLGDKSFKCVLDSEIPAKEYDIVVSDRAHQSASYAVKKFKPKWFLCFYPNGDKGCWFRSEEYEEFEQGCFKRKMLEDASRLQAAQAAQVEQALPASQARIDEAIEESDAVDRKDFEAYLKSAPMSASSYDPHYLKYIYEQVPGRVSIVIVITGKYTKMNSIIAAIKAQKLDDYEILLVDNFAGFKTNFKSAIRYSLKEVDPDYAKWRARELTTGEFIFILDQDSEVPDFREEIANGKYSVR